MKLNFEEQGKRMRESIREEIETWARALEKKYGIVQPKEKKKVND
jgi:hypothetical protein